MTWLKRCNCGRVHTWEDWQALSFAFVKTHDREPHEGRQCHCQSTLEIILYPLPADVQADLDEVMREIAERDAA